MLPVSEQTLVIRTDFSDDASWGEICRAIRTPSPGFGFLGNVEFVDDRQYDEATPEALAAQASRDASLFFVVDRTALTHPERPILVVDYFETPLRTLRVIPSELWGIENNLSLGNMDFEEFADNAGPDGIFRGWGRI